MKKKGITQLVAGVLLIVLIIAIVLIIFSFVFRTATLETQKSGDKAMAQEICRENVKIRVKDVESDRIVEDEEIKDVLKIDVENLKGQDVTDFVVRVEQGGNVDISKVRQILGGYEEAILTIDKNLEPSVVKVIPRITLKKPEITSIVEGWWLCSDQMVTYNVK